MTHEVIIKKVIEKIRDKEPYKDYYIAFEYGEDELGYFRIQKPSLKRSNLFKVNEIIFSHNFAKAFWGEMAQVEFHDCPTCEYPGYVKDWAWSYHLQQMVLDVDPIRYLEKFL